MHDLGFRLNGASRSVQIAVLCGVEALSAQQWAVGAISLCAVFCASGERMGHVVPTGICGTVSRLRTNKG
jgi:hypothetical protein